ncbi:myosin regulatory light chain 2 [Caerostris darwini]|uniref:Myosin regulatory light chain 2 n=1 Tax=Caerostris darwini TaxID=1538125 RepID=A0AAV4RQ31_9ARAC|nr:myosin regulatory light chain 2 [Caerostris darwini]
MGDEDKKEKKKKTKKKAEEEAAPEAAPAPAAPASKPASQKRRAQRSGSNVFAQFTPHQVQEFKEAFNLIDQDKDGFISKNDIRATFDSLGRLTTEPELESMMSEASGPINFTMFLTIFGDRIAGTDEEDVIVNAFNMYDEGEGKCREETLKRALTTWGEKFSEAECDEALEQKKRREVKKSIPLQQREVFKGNYLQLQTAFSKNNTHFHHLASTPALYCGYKNKSQLKRHFLRRPACECVTLSSSMYQISFHIIYRLE